MFIQTNTVYSSLSLRFIISVNPMIRDFSVFFLYVNLFFRFVLCLQFSNFKWWWKEIHIFRKDKFTPKKPYGIWFWIVLLSVFSLLLNVIYWRNFFFFNLIKWMNEREIKFSNVWLNILAIQKKCVFSFLIYNWWRYLRQIH